MAGPHLHSLGERLAHEHGGIAAHTLEEPVHASTIWVLTDGMDLDAVEVDLQRVSGGETRRVVVVDAPASCVRERFGDWPVCEAHPDDPLHLWRAVREALQHEARSPGPLPSVFVSHAVVDEPILQPVVDYLRRFTGVEIFLCADSIPAGAQWREDIEAALERSDRFVWIGSEAAFRSIYCAYEVGQAVARGTPCRVIVLDGAAPPPFVAHVQAVDLIRHRSRRPWLSQQDALTEALLDALA